MKRLFKTTALGLAILNTVSAQVYALQKPLHLAADSRIEAVSYSPDNVVPIHGTPFIATEVIFGSDEHILNIQNGDADAWTISPIDKSVPNVIFIKPTAYDSHTNLMVITDRHTYYFKLDSAGNRSKTATYAVKFHYSDAGSLEASIEALKSAPALNPSEYNSNYTYSLSSDKRILPVHVFDDGRFTYMQLQNKQAVPAVFAVDNKEGKEAVVNFRTQGKYLVIDRVAPEYTLREGHQVASIFNSSMIKKLNSSH